MRSGSYVMKTIRIIYSGAPLNFVICIILLLFISCFEPLSLMAISRFTDALTEADLQKSKIVCSAAYLILTLLLTNSKSLINLLGSYLWITSEIALQKLMIEKAASKPLLFYDTAAFYRRLERAKEGYGYAVSTVMMLISAVFISGCSFLWIMAYLATVNTKVVAALVVIVCIKCFSYLIETHSLQNLREKQAERRNENKLLSEYLWCKESRIFGASNYFYDRWKASNAKIVGEECRVIQKNRIIGLLLDVLIYACYGGVVFYIVLSMLETEHVAINGIIVFFVAIEAIFRNLDSVIRQCGNVVENLSLSKDLFDFLCEEECNEQSGQDGEKTKCSECEEEESNEIALRLEHVCFRYPQSDVDALRDINLVVKQGEKIAVVGKNGSGKTTLVKILNGLYDPVSGRIYRREKNSSTMFQEICTYNLTLGENIRIGDYERDDMHAPAQRLDPLIASLFGEKWDELYPDGEETLIGREFGGIELSGGQKQRLSMARAIYRRRELAFFDEPTGAIDSAAEEKLLEVILGESEGKTVFYITHHLSTVRFADRIIVMDKGRIAEQGTHKELIAKNGIYADMFNKQREGYF